MLVSRYHPFFWLLNSQLILSSFTKSAIRSLSPCLVKKTSILFETPPEIELSMAVSEFPEWLYAITYMDIFSNYPKNCPQEMGIISEMSVLRNQEKLQF